MTRRNFGFSFAPPSGFHGANATAGEHRQPRLSPAPVAAAVQTARVGLSGGNLERPLSRHDAYNTRADSIPLPCGSLIDPGSALLERDNLFHAVRDGLAVAGAALFLTVTGISLVAAFFMTFFCEF